ncbi:MAG: Ig-like domain-containing protein, partial [Hormoscilla sp.]
VTANSGSNDLSLLQSNGDGTFTNFPLPLPFPDGVTVSSLRAADEDGDGNADFLVGTNIENNTIVGVRTTLETFEFPVGDSPVSVALADFNGDGNIDGAIANSGDDTVTILTNINNEDVTTDSISVGTAPSYITAADIDGDEDQDLIVVSNGSNTVSILRNDGAGNFQMISERAVGNSPVWATAADLNGDDTIDLAVVNSEDDSISLSLNDGSGSFFSAGTIQVGSNPLSLTAADLDGDSDIDLAVVNSDDNNVSVWRNNGNASFDPSVTVTVGSNPASVTAADLDEDGDIDLAVANEDSDDVSVILNNGLVPVSDGGSDGGDTVTGGAGNDSFVLNGPDEGVDTIADFVPGEDSLLISQDVFGDEFTPETVDESQFTLGTAATTPDHRFIYDMDTGTLFFDADGNGGATGVQLAVLTAGIEISAADIIVVESVTVPNRSPVAAGDRATITQNSTGTIDVLANDVDLDNDPISLTGFEGTSANGGNVTRNDNATTDDLTDDRLVYTPAVDFIGTDSFRYSISDGRGTDTGTVTIIVGSDDDGPTSDLSVTASVSNSSPAEGEEIAYSIQVSGQSAASNIELRSQLPAGLNLQYTTTSLGVYDLNTGIWRIPTLPTGRTATLELNVEVGSGIAGETLFNEVVVISPSGVDNQGTVPITISGGNQSPIAIDDEVTTDLEMPVAVDVLANDIDPDEDSLEVTGVGVAENGNVSIIGNQVIYRPDAEFAGTDSFTYTISDGRGGTDTATITVIVAPENQDPNAVPDEAIATVGQTIGIDVLANDFDPDEEAIGLAAFQRQTAAGGTVVRNDNGTARDIRDDFLEYTPAAGFTGTDSFAYRIRDRQGATDTAQVTVNVTAAEDLNGTTVEDISILGSLSDDDLVAGAGNDNLTGDLGNDTLTGGTGSDRFIFNSPDEALDLITDFEVFSDAIGVSAAGFGAGLIQGNLDPNQFTLGVAASDPNHRFIYGNDGSLFFDADGTGAIGQVQIATLSGGPAEFSASNIIVL